MTSRLRAAALPQALAAIANPSDAVELDLGWVLFRVDACSRSRR